MQHGWAQASGLLLRPLLLARWVTWVAPVRQTHGVWFVVARPSVALGAHICAVSWATWFLFTGVPVRCVALRARCPGPLGSPSPVCPLGMFCLVCGVPGPLSPVHLCAGSVCCVALPVRFPRPLGSCSPVFPLGVLRHMCGVLGPLAPVHRCALPLRCVACAVSWATWLLFTRVLSRCVVSRVRCPWPVSSCSSVCLPTELRCVCGVLRHLAHVHRCAPSVRLVACVLCPRPLSSRSSVCSLGALCCLCGVLGHLALVHPCARELRYVACAVSWATLLLFNGLPAQCPASCVRCYGPLGYCSPVCYIAALSCVCGVLGHLAPVHRGARSVFHVACAVSWATSLLYIGVLARCVALRVCAVMGHLTPVHRCARSVRCVGCAVSWATWLLITGVLAHCVVLRDVVSWATRLLFTGLLPRCVAVRVCRVLGHLVPLHRCARSVRVVACAVSWATWLLFTGVLSHCVVLRDAVSPPPRLVFTGVFGFCVALRVCGVLGHLAPVHRCARSVRCAACALSWATWLLFTAVLARCVVLRDAVSWATRLLFTGVLARCVALRACGVLGHLAPDY